MFKIGDRVKCIDDNLNGDLDFKTLKKGSEYVVQDIRNCSCGNTHLNVGATVFDKRKGWSCAWCDSVLTEIGEVNVWFFSKRFVKTQEKYKAVTIQIEKEEPILS